jgi:DNA-binding beta-propeller fold protein YncE/N-acetylneuraminic acid mutarotase
MRTVLFSTALLFCSCTVEIARDPAPLRCEVDRSCPAGFGCDADGFCIAIVIDGGASDAGSSDGGTTNASDAGPRSECTAPGSEGRACDDGNACTRRDVCQGGACVGSDPVRCDASRPWCLSTCDPQSGSCVGRRVLPREGLTLVGRVVVGRAPSALALDEGTQHLFVTNQEDATVTVLDTREGQASLVATIGTDARPSAIAVNPSTHRAFTVTNVAPYAISVLDGDPASATTNTVIARIVVDGRDFGQVRSLAVDDAMNRVYVPSFDPGGRVAVIDGETNEFLSLITVAANPLVARFDPIARRVHVGHGTFFGRRRMTEIDANTGSASDGVETGLGVHAIAVDPIAHRVWLRKGDEGRGERAALLALDGATRRLLAQFRRSGPGDVALNASTGRVYAVDNGTTTLTAFDGAPSSPTEFQRVSTVIAGAGEKRLAADPANGRVYIAESVSNTLAIFDDINVSTDSENCGECGHVCATGETCRAGRCVRPGWAPMDGASSPPPVHDENPIAIWTGARMLVWGGNGGADSVLPRHTGGLYDPLRDAWGPMSTTNAPAPRRGHTSVWTGIEMIVWGGTPYDPVGGRYDPSSDAWRLTNMSLAPSARERHAAVWTGTSMIVWGGRDASGIAVGDGARYDPTRDAWTPMSTRDAPAPRLGHAAVWTGRELVVWGGGDGSGCPLRSGGRYDPATDSWRGISTTHPETPELGWHSSRALWTGREMFLWGGIACAALPMSMGGYLYDPLEDTWRRASREGAPEPRGGEAVVWTGRQVLVWGGGRYASDGFLYDPDANAWTPMRSENAPLARRDMAHVWTGAELIVWGGLGEAGLLEGGGRYTLP